MIGSYTRAIAVLIVGLSTAFSTPNSLLQMAKHYRLPVKGTEVRSSAAGGGDFLWLATRRGLFRFDGRHFERIFDGDLETVAVTTDGWVWAGGAKGLTAFRRGQRLKVLEHPVVSVVARGAEVVVNAGRLFRGTVGQLKPVDVAVQGLLALDRDQRVWFGCGSEVCSLDIAGSLEHVGEQQGLPRATWLSALRSDEGLILAQREPAQNELEMVFLRPDGQAVRRKRGPLPMALDRMFFRAHDGTIWTGVARAQPYDLWTSHQAQGLFGISHTEDARGNHWISTMEEDLYLLSERQWVEAWRAPRFTESPEQARRTRDGKVLVSTKTGLFEFDASMEHWSRRPGELGSNHVTAVTEASNGELWALFPDLGIRRMDGEGRTTSSVFSGPKRVMSFRGLNKDRDGNIWVTGKKHLFRIDEAAAQLVGVPLPHGGSNPVGFAAGPDGQEWLGYESGIAKREGREWKLVVPSSELADPRIRSIAVGPGPEFWVSYRRAIPISLVRREGAKWIRRDLPFEGSDALSLIRDRRGWIWVGTDSGLMVSDGVHVEPDDWVTLDESQNLPSKAITLDGLTEDQDGSILVSTERGLARVHADPAWFAPSRESARVTALRWPGSGQDLWPAAEVRLPAGVRDLEIYFARWPGEVPRDDRLYFRLTPGDTAWQNRTEAKAHYDMMRPGQYVFEMKGRDGEPVSTFRFEIPPDRGSLVSCLG